MDLIDRQAAINALDRIGSLDTEADKKYARSVFEALPSVQPQPVVRCKDCKWFGKIGCAVQIVDESDKPSENDFCSFAERRTDE